MLYYVGYYNCDLIRHEDRIVAPASENKMGYIISAISEASDSTFEVISPAETRKNRFVRGRKIALTEQVVLKTFSSFHSRVRAFRIMGHLLTRILFFLYLLLNVKTTDHLIVYHSLAYRSTIKLIQKIKKCKLTFEVEELYSDVICDDRLRKKEINYLQIADSYIFITELLREQVNTQKNYIISHGTYRSVQNYGFTFEDNSIHVVYAGTFRKAKGGVYTAIESANFLDDRYTLEILGSGSDEEILDVQRLIQQTSQQTKCRIKYVGFKTGKDFDSYIQACQIGLSTQQADARFSTTSFPSKILMYMSNGLKVVSVRIKAIETSRVGDIVYYFDKQDVKGLSEAIKAASIDETFDTRNILDTLHRSFIEELKSLM